MGIYEVIQGEYAEVMENNPGSFIGESLLVENVSWMDAVRYCNAFSEREGLEPVYMIDRMVITWNRSVDEYGLSTEAESEYACWARTTTPFNTESSISSECMIQ